jgi:hypothetical protein
MAAVADHDVAHHEHGGPEFVAAMIDELRELHLGIPRPDPHAPRASDQLNAAYEAALI